MKQSLPIALFALITPAILLMSSCKFSEPISSQEDDDTIAISATFYPLGSFAEAVGGEHVTVEALTPAGSEPHDYEPSPRDIERILTSDLFLANGAGLDPWAEDLTDELNMHNVRMIIMTQDMRNLIVTSGDEHDEEDEEKHMDEDEDEHREGNTDPHIWLDPIHAKSIVDRIADALVEIDGAHADAYRANAEAYKQQLDALDAQYKQDLASCALNKVIVSHAAFAYLADRYGFEMHPISGLSPEEEPSPRRLAELSHVAKENDIDVILFETLVSPKLSEALAREVGATTLVLNPLEGLTPDEVAQGMDYISVMRDNLKSLQTALRCS